MTNDAESRTPIDDMIDAVAREMTMVAAPDLRMRIANRHAARRPEVPWWKPALAAAVVLVAAVLFMPARDVKPPRTPQPHPEHRAEQVVEPPVLRSNEVQGNVQPARTSIRTTVPRRTAAAAETLPEDIRSLPAVVIAPMTIEALPVDTPRSLDAVGMAALVVAPLNVEPLSRNNP